MKFTCLQENLVKGLSIAGKAVSTKGSLPVLSNVLIATDKGRLKLSATNLETAITIWIGASIDKEGSVTIPARLLYEFVSNLPPSNVEGSSDGLSLKLQCGKTSSKFNGLSASEFPTIPESIEDISLSVDPKVFGDAVLETGFAAAADESRPVLTGILLKTEKEKLYLVSVDGFRLAERIVTLPSKLKEGISAVIPSKLLMEVARLTSTLKGPMEISLNKEGNLAVFKIGDILVSSRTLDGDFPPYEKLIPDPSKCDIKVKMSSKDFVNSLKLANVFAKDAVSVVKFKISPDDDTVYISSSNAEVGENSNALEAEIEGPELSVAFNSRYIMDVLSNVKADSFTFECPEKIGPGVPGVLRPFGRKDYLYLVMPLQI